MSYFSPVTLSASAAVAAYAANRNMSPILVSDSSANIAGHLDALNAVARAGKISSIALTDPQPLPVAEAQMTSDSLVLGLLPHGAMLSVGGVSVADAGVLQANPHVASIAVSDSPAAVVAAFGALNNDGKVSSVTLVGGTVLAISYSQYGAYSRVLGTLSPGVTLTVSAVAAAAAAAVQADARVTGFAVADATANVAAALSSLAADSKLSSITLSDKVALALTFAQYNAAAAVLAKLSASSTLTVAAVPVAQATAMQGSARVSGFSVSDTAAAIGGALPTLMTATKLTVLSVTDGSPLALTYAQTGLYAVVLGKLAAGSSMTASGVPVAQAAAMQQNRQTGSFTVLDSSSAVAAGLDALNGDGKISGIVLTDASPLAVGYAQSTADSVALGKLPAWYWLAVSKATATAAAAMQASAHVAAFSVADTAANVSAALDALNADGKLTAIAITDAGLVTMTMAQLFADPAAMQKLAAGALLAVTGVSAMTAAAIQTYATVTSFSVTDTAANVSAALGSLAGDSKLSAILLADNAALVVTPWAMSAYAAVFAKLPATYRLATAGASVADAAALQANAHVAFLNVTDTAAAITSGFDALNSDGNLTSITVSDGAPLALRYGQWATDTTALASLAVGTSIALSGVTTSGLAAVQADARVTAFSVADTAANVQSALALLSGAGRLTAITLSDAAALTLDVSQLTTDQAALAKLAGSNNLIVNGVPAAQVTALQASPAVAWLSVRDTAAALSGALAALGAAAKLTSLTVTDGNVLPLTDAQWTAYGGLIAKLTAGSTVSVSGVPVSQATAVQGSAAVASFGVADTAAAVGAFLAALNADTKLSALALSDGATLPLGYADMMANSAALGKLTSVAALSVSGVAVAQAAAIQADARVGSFAVADSAPAIQSALANLNADSKLTGLSVFGGTLTVTAAQFAADTVAVGKLATGTALALSGVTAAGAATAQANAAVASFSLADTAVNVSAGLDALNGDGKLIAIMLTSGPSMAISYAQWLADSSALGKLPAGCKLAVSGVPAAAAAAMQASSAVASFSVTAGSADVTAVRASLGLDTKLTAVVLTDSTPLAMSYADLQTQSVTTLRARLPSTYTMVISAAPSGPACAALQGLAHVVSYSMAASAATIVAALPALASDTRLTAIAASPGSVVTVTSAQFSANAPVLNKLSTAWTITGVSAADAAGAQQGSNGQASFSVSDSSVNVASALGMLGGCDKLASIALTDARPLALTYAAFAASAGVLGKMQAGYTLAISAATVGNAAALQANAHVASFAINDTAAALAAALPALNADTKLTAATVSDGKPLTLTYASFSTCAKALAALQGTYALTVSQTSAAAAAGVAANSHVAAVSVADTLARVGSNLSSLETLAKAGSLTAIAVSDAGGSLTLSAAQAGTDKEALALMTGSFSIMETGTSSASASPGLNAASLSFIGTPAVVALGSGVTINAGLVPTSGIEEITNFQYGVDHLLIDLQGVAASRLAAYDTSVGGQHAIALASSVNQTHGIVLLGMATSAADLTAHHLSFANGSATVT